ncbi:hypothetical protein CCP1ISM_470003 [Azospirillaceae bacterium]|jgi:hypothetical protein
MIITIENMKIDGKNITMTTQAAKEFIEELKIMIDETEHHDVYRAMLVTDSGQFNLLVKK